MPRFLTDFPDVDDAATSRAGWNRGLVEFYGGSGDADDRIMTALLQLGAFVGAAMSGFFADRYSRKASIGKSTGRISVGELTQQLSVLWSVLWARE
jgi:MFS family permease